MRFERANGAPGWAASSSRGSLSPRRGLGASRRRGVGREEEKQDGEPRRGTVCGWEGESSTSSCLSGRLSGKCPLSLQFFSSVRFVFLSAISGFVAQQDFECCNALDFHVLSIRTFYEQLKHASFLGYSSLSLPHLYTLKVPCPFSLVVE